MNRVRWLAISTHPPPGSNKQRNKPKYSQPTTYHKDSGSQFTAVSHFVGCGVVQSNNKNNKDDNNNNDDDDGDNKN